MELAEVAVEDADEKDDRGLLEMVDAIRDDVEVRDERLEVDVASLVGSWVIVPKIEVTSV